MLAKNDGPGAEEPSSGVAQAPPPNIQYSNNMLVSGSGTFSKEDVNESSEIMTDQISFAPGGATSLNFGDKEAIKVDSEGEITFGDEMAKAIRQAAQNEATINEAEKGEVTDEQE